MLAAFGTKRYSCPHMITEGRASQVADLQQQGEALASTQRASGLYQQPSQTLLDTLHAANEPQVLFSPTLEFIVFLDYIRYPSIAELAEPAVNLAGHCVNPRNNGPQRVPRFVRLRLKRMEAEHEISVLLPHGARIGHPHWSPGGQSFVFTNTTTDAIELWLCDAATGHARRLEGLRPNTVLGTPAAWLADSSSLVVDLIPESRGVGPLGPTTIAGPHVHECSGRRHPTLGQRNLLSTPFDEAAFDYYLKSQLAIVDLTNSQLRLVGEPGIFPLVSPSPNGEFFLVVRIHRPYSNERPLSAFPRAVEIWDRSGRLIYKVASLPVAEDVPRDGVSAAPREFSWHPLEPATLIWVEALDEGDPERRVPHRDRVVTLVAPFTNPPHELIRTEYRFSSLRWTDLGTHALLSEYDRVLRQRRAILVDVAQGTFTATRVLWSHSIDDRYAHPGTPICRALPNGRHAICQHEDSIFVAGEGAMPTGKRPFLDRLCLKSLQTTRLFESNAKRYEEVTTLLARDGSSFIVRTESTDSAPNYAIRRISKGHRPDSRKRLNYKRRSRRACSN